MGVEGLPALTRSITIQQFPGLHRPLGYSAVQPLIRRNAIPVISARRGARGVLTLITLSLEQARGMVSLIDTSPLFLLTGPPERGFGPGLYLLATDYEEQRWLTYANEPTRLFVITVMEVDRPPLDVVVPPQNTWAEWGLDETNKWSDWKKRRHLDILTEEGVP